MILSNVASSSPVMVPTQDVSTYWVPNNLSEHTPILQDTLNGHRGPSVRLGREGKIGRPTQHLQNIAQQD